MSGNATIIPVSGDPTGKKAPFNQLQNSDNGSLYYSSNGTVAEVGGGSSSGVSKLNGETGDITLTEGSGITITPSGQNIEIAASGGAGLVLKSSTTLTSAQILEMNQVDTVTSAVNNGDGTTTYVGVFPNGNANALAGGFYTIAGFSDDNDGSFGPASASTLTSITLPNSSGVTEAGTATATNLGYQILAGVAGKNIVPLQCISEYKFVSAPYVLSYTSVLLGFDYPLAIGVLSDATSVAAMGLLDSDIDSLGISYVEMPPSYQEYIGQPIILGGGGGGATYSDGDGTLTITTLYTLQ